MRFQEAADQGFVLLNRHASLLLIANPRLSPTGWQHEHDATQRGLAHRAQAYSPKCPEGKFSEVHIQDPAYRRWRGGGGWPIAPPEHRRAPTRCGSVG